jgi:hypothetical protein
MLLVTASMRMAISRTFRCGVSAFMGLVLMMAMARGGVPDQEKGVSLFQEKIKPVLEAECYRCHSAKAEKVKGGLLLDSRAGLVKGGDTGPAVVPGKSGESLLIQAIRHEEGLAMPPKKPRLSDQTIADFVEWVELGAPVPGMNQSSEAIGMRSADVRRHWSFQPVHKADPPRVANTAWIRNEVDAFILAKLDDHQWQPAPPAGRIDWIRRVTFDLTGLPPSPEEIESYRTDPSPDADGRVVDRLLSSPHYGERWAQPWLDVVRYAETEGYEYDRHIPDAWRYRDYVIQSLNKDKPFDRFLIEQIAGDEIAPGDAEAQTAVIFYRLGPVRRNAGNPEIALSRNEVLTERTDIIGSAFMGLTVGCARCHNHKLEPITQKDYYRLQAYLAATEEHNIVLAAASEKAWEAATQRIKFQIQELQKRIKNQQGDRPSLTAQIEALEDQLPAPQPTIPSTWNDLARRTAIHVLKRGVWEDKGEQVGPRPLSVLVADGLPELPADIPNPRSRLARWLASSDHPLTARVIVNRLWQHHFGTGLVKTVNDFGTKGDPPSHPELLDWLAATLVENGWRLKPIHRLMVISNTYKQSSETPLTTQASRSDPGNRLLWRFNRRRLSAEEIRDAMLSVSGRINLKGGGPSVMVSVNPELVQLLYKPSQWKVAGDKAEHDRRSIFLIAKRNLRLPFFEVFDAPALTTSCPRRESSTHAPQALELLNGRLSNNLAAAFASRLERETGGVPERVIERAFRRALGRPPTSQEHELSLEFLREQPLKEFALAVFNLNEFLYVP